MRSRSGSRGSRARVHACARRHRPAFGGEKGGAGGSPPPPRQKKQARRASPRGFSPSGHALGPALRGVIQPTLHRRVDRGPGRVRRARAAFALFKDRWCGQEEEEGGEWWCCSALVGLCVRRVCVARSGAAWASEWTRERGWPPVADLARSVCVVWCERTSREAAVGFGSLPLSLSPALLWAAPN